MAPKARQTRGQEHSWALFDQAAFVVFLPAIVRSIPEVLEISAWSLSDTHLWTGPVEEFTNLNTQTPLLPPEG